MTKMKSMGILGEAAMIYMLEKKESMKHEPLGLRGRSPEVQQEESKESNLNEQEILDPDESGSEQAAD